MRLLALLAALFLAAPAALTAATWQADETTGRYTATVAGWTLVVDPARARLVSLAPPGGENILLDGGHRLWLGPQSEWPVFWPAPADWESSPAASVTLSADAAELTLAHPRADLRHPALTRRYHIKGDALLLVASWRIEKTDTPFAAVSRQAVQILQTRPDTVAFATPRPTPAAPLGHALLALNGRPGTDLASPLPPGLAAPAHSDCGCSGGKLRFTFNGTEEKVGLPPQPLRALLPGGHGLVLHPATHDAVVDPSLPAPEAGLYTQIYFGGTGWDMVELEQLSPRLLPARPDGRIETTVRLEFLSGRTTSVSSPAPSHPPGP